MNNKEIGTGWSFPPRFNKYARGVEMVSGEEEIQESLKILFSTKLGERLFRNNYGCSLDEYKFSTNTPTTALLIKNAITYAVENFEPRITLADIDVDTSSMEEGKLVFMIKYIINATNRPSNLVYLYEF